MPAATAAQSKLDPSPRPHIPGEIPGIRIHAHPSRQPHRRAALVEIQPGLAGDVAEAIAIEAHVPSRVAAEVFGEVAGQAQADVAVLEALGVEVRGAAEVEGVEVAQVEAALDGRAVVRGRLGAERAGGGAEVEAAQVVAVADAAAHGDVGWVQAEAGVPQLDLHSHVVNELANSG